MSAKRYRRHVWSFFLSSNPRLFRYHRLDRSRFAERFRVQRCKRDFTLRRASFDGVVPHVQNVPVAHAERRERLFWPEKMMGIIRLRRRRNRIIIGVGGVEQQVRRIRAQRLRVDWNAPRFLRDALLHVRDFCRRRRRRRLGNVQPLGAIPSADAKQHYFRRRLRLQSRRQSRLLLCER